PLSIYDDAIRARGPRGARALPVAHVHPEDGPDGQRTFVVRAAPIEPRGGELQVVLRWTAPAPLRGGVVRFRLPARGRDPRAAPAEIRLSSEAFLSPAVNGQPFRDRPFLAEAWIPVELSALAPHGRALDVQAWHF